MPVAEGNAIECLVAAVHLALIALSPHSSNWYLFELTEKKIFHKLNITI
ncbi:hypothetical protein CLOSTMETH_01491 [[Clostridium] methylpentosum DSM 5476]|uniref:Uncharacterized protein n=1 Tax=[Clostridium] methylpentosum DSM 5476 TaxID=537013 RepID=C0ECC2_9FIRM|nr:hypothetical protein CLOSTMETH_01491 [[Clostridium] methylpentosum DSM 5476]